MSGSTRRIDSSIAVAPTAAYDAEDLVVVLEQELGEQRPILAADTGDEGATRLRHGRDCAGRGGRRGRGYHALLAGRGQLQARNSLKVAILAGGQGTRLAEETEVKPKPMVEIGGRPILWHIMKHYASYGHTDFVIALG